MAKPVHRGCTLGVKFRPGFDMKLLYGQNGGDRWAHNRLLELLRTEYGRQGWVNCSRARINKWYTGMRRRYPFLRRTVSHITREKLHKLGMHFDQYVETQRLLATGEKPSPEYGEPRFRRYSDHISIALIITNNKGTARFLGPRTIRIQKMGDIFLSNDVPVLNYRPKRATLYQTADGKWRLGLSYETDIGAPDGPKPDEIMPLGIDRNTGNISTPDAVIVKPDSVVAKEEKLERNTKHWQRVMDRRQKPNRRERVPGSNRYEKARKTRARRERELSNVRKNAAYKTANVIRNMGATHAVVEDLNYKNMVKSAKGTKEKPGRNVAQKKGLNRSIQSQMWGLLALILSYSLAGGIIRVWPAYTSRTCSRCLHADKNSRHKRLFRCTSCGFVHHADCNAGCNIENRGREKLGLPRMHIESLVWPAQAGPALGIGQQDVEGGSTAGRAGDRTAGDDRPAKRQAWTEVEGVVSEKARVVRLWDDV